MDSERLCENCQYNLRGLTEPRCPECGLGFLLDHGHPTDQHTTKQAIARCLLILLVLCNLVAVYCVWILMHPRGCMSGIVLFVPQAPATIIGLIARAIAARIGRSFDFAVIGMLCLVLLFGVSIVLV